MEKDIIKTEAYTMYVSGNYYEVGYQIGKIVKKHPTLLAKCMIQTTDSNTINVEQTNALLDRWCPGLSEEIAGFATALDVKLENLYFYSMTYLVPCCSQIALLSKVTKDNKPLLIRNYEFLEEVEDFCLMKTSIDGKYTHIGTSMLLFGRDDGCNEHGLAVTMTSCGLPIANMPHTKKPTVVGLQYWVVVRAILENCKTVAEAIQYIDGMPIAFNMNLMLLDKQQHVALIQTMNGKLTIKHLDSTSTQQVLYTTNHSILPEVQYLEPYAFNNSIVRYNIICKAVENKQQITKEKLKKMLLTKYPEGICFWHFKEGFGTTKSIIFSPIDRMIEICWGGNLENKWKTYTLDSLFNNEMFAIELTNEPMRDGFFNLNTI